MASGVGYKKSDFFIDIARGKYPNISPEHKGGFLPECTTTQNVDVTVWNTDGAQTLWHPPATATEHMEVVSSNVGDTGQTVRIGYLDANWDEQFVEVAITGNTPKTITEGDAGLVPIDIARINAFRIISGSAPLGNIHIRTDGYSSQPGEYIYRTISIGNFRAQSSVFSVPNGKTFYLTGWHCSAISGETNTNAHFRVYSNGAEVASPRVGVYEEVVACMVPSSTSFGGSIQREFVIPIAFCAGSDVYTNVHTTKTVNAATFTAVSEIEGWIE